MSVGTPPSIGTILKPTKPHAKFQLKKRKQETTQNVGFADLSPKLEELSSSSVRVKFPAFRGEDLAVNYTLHVTSDIGRKDPITIKADDKSEEFSEVVLDLRTGDRYWFSVEVDCKSGAKITSKRERIIPGVSRRSVGSVMAKLSQSSSKQSTGHHNMQENKTTPAKQIINEQVAPPPPGVHPSTSSSNVARPPAPPPVNILTDERKEQQKGATKWLVGIDDDKIDFSTAHACSKEAFDDPNIWKKVTTVCKSENGSIGVMLVQTEEGILVVKSGSTMVQELFATKIAKILGVSVADIRVVGYRDSGEWRDIKNAIKKAAKSFSSSAYLERQLKRAMLSIMEFVPGVTLGNPKCFYARNENEILSSHQLEELGGLIIFDILMNNADRIPCGVFNELNEGNPGNFIVGDTNVTGIDQNIVSLDINLNAEKVATHIETVKHVIRDIVDGNYESKCFSQIQGYMHSFSGETFPETSLKHLRRGMLKLCDVICERISLQLLQDVKEEVNCSIVIDWEDVWRDMVALILPEFHQKVVVEAFIPNWEDVKAKLKVYS